MKKGAKIFRIIICVLLAFAIIGGALFAALFLPYLDRNTLEAGYGIYVADVPVTRRNNQDVLGDGSVYYDAYNNILTFDNATIESESWAVYSNIDLNIQLIGENKFVCTNESYSAGVYVGDHYLSKDIAFIGDGSLTIELPGTSGEAVGISAAVLTVTNDITIITSDCENKVHGIVCGSSLMVVNKGTVTVKTGAAKNSVGIRVRDNALFEEGTALNVSVNPGATENCKGLSVSGDLFLGKNASLNVSVDDEATDLGQCIRVSGLMEIESGATVQASAKKTHAIECFGSIKANNGAAISAVSEKKEADIFCSGAVINDKATFNAETEALGGMH